MNEWLVQFTRFELLLSSASFALFFGRCRMKLSLISNFLASLIILILVILAHILSDQFLSISIWSLMLTIILGICVTFDLRFFEKFAYPLVIFFGVMHALSAIEQLYFVMSFKVAVAVSLTHFIICIVIMALMKFFHQRNAFNWHRIFASWVAAAGILIFANFI